jgi:integrase
VIQTLPSLRLLVKPKAANVTTERIAPNHPFDSDERDAILAWFARNEPYWCPWLFFLFWTGVRHGEAAALRWNDTDPKRGIISISRSRDEGEDNAPNTAGSTRELPHPTMKGTR